MSNQYTVRGGKIAAFLSSMALIPFISGVAFAQAEDDSDEQIDEIVTVGSQIKGATISDALSVSVIDADDIEVLGFDSGDELLQFMPEQGENFFNNIDGNNNSARGDVGAYNLRNLGTGNTLVLLNGRRMVNAASYQTEEVGGSFIPVNTVNSQSLPVFGLQRVEVLRDGASAIYGADAVAGVINYVLKNDFEGFDIRLRLSEYANIPRQDQRITVEWGKNFNGGNTNISVFADFYHRDRVSAQDDPKWADANFDRFLPDDSPWKTTFNPDGTVDDRGDFDNTSSHSAWGQLDIRGGSVPGITDGSGQFETYPTGDSRCQYVINATTCGAVNGQGTFRHNNNETRDLLGELDRINFFAFLNHEFGNGVESYTEFSAYISETNTVRYGSTRLSAVSKHRMAADNYYNPFGPVGSDNRLPDSVIGVGTVPDEGYVLEFDNYRFGLPSVRSIDNDGETYRVLQGFRGTMGTWDWDTAVLWSRATKEDINRDRVSNTLLQQALDDTTATAFNPFGGYDNNSEQFLVDIRRDNETELTLIDFKLSKYDLFEMPAGPVGFLVGFEFRNESFIDDRDPRLDGTINFVDATGDTYPFVSDAMSSSPTADSRGDRDVTSLFTEFQVPVFETLDLQLALRYEDFSDIGDTTVGKIAFGWRPIEQLLFRGSWSEAFRVPNLVTVNESGVARSNTRNDFVCFQADPSEAVLDCRHGVQRTAAGSDDLVPEESTNTSIGVVFEPNENLTFTLDFWEIEKDNTIGLFGEENHSALDLLLRLEAGTANCAAFQGNSATVYSDIADRSQEELDLYLAAGICPAGELARVEDEYANLDTRTVQGFDVGAYFNFDTSIGNFDIRYVASFLEKYEQVAGGDAALLVEAKESGALPGNVPVTGFADLVRQDGNAESKHTIRVNWRKGSWGATVSGVRLDDIVVTDETLADGTEWVLPSMTTFNASFDYMFGWGDNVDARVRLGIRNFTDERAPLADGTYGYFQDMHRDLGRNYYLDFRVAL